MKILSFVIFILLVVSAGKLLSFSNILHSPQKAVESATTSVTPTQNTFPLSIAAMRVKKYPGSNITITQNVSSNNYFKEYVAFYLSDGLKIYGLLAIPQGQPPKGGWPVILVNHGYVPPTQYLPTGSYKVIADAFSYSGYVVFMPDYRGNGNSQGQPTQVYISSDYVTDSLNALASIKKYSNVNPNKVGVFGHSMGGNVTLHELVITNQFKAAAIWAGVVGSYTDILNWWKQRIVSGVLTTKNDQQTAALVNQFISQHGTPQTNPVFWKTIDPIYFLSSIQSPVQISVGTADNEVPTTFSQNFYNSLKKLNKNATINTYSNADHNLQPYQLQAMQKTIAFFNKYLK